MPDDVKASILLLVPAGERNDPYGIGLDSTGRTRVILVDLGDNHVVGIIVEDPDDETGADQARFDALVAAAMPVIESFTFK